VATAMTKDEVSTELVADCAFELEEPPVVAVWPDSASSSVSLAEARLASAVVTWDCSEVVSSRASASPAVTRSPPATSTEATDPETGKLTSALRAGCTVPTSDSVCVTSPRVTVAVT
jgi:hypothetical protein